MIDDKDWNIKMTDYARKTESPIRKVWEKQNIVINPSKKMITLQIGDPTVFKNFLAARECRDAIKNAVDNDYFSYSVCEGSEIAREAIAKYINKNNRSVGGVEESSILTYKDVILTSGCSMALEMCYRVLAEQGDNILIPQPSWCYAGLILGNNINIKYYRLNPIKGWDVDIDHLESMIDEKTKAILINNPGNPCGNVFSKEHLLDILEVAERHKIPIIADEVYEFFTFPGVQFYPLAALSKNVPILYCSGLTKRFLMPGARMGWICIHDRNNQLDEIRKGLLNIAGKNFWPNSSLTNAMPEILENVPQKFFDDNCEAVYKHALTAFKILEKCPGLIPIIPKGAMFMMTKIELEKFPKISTCFDFYQNLLGEQSVALFPGFPCLNFPGFFRIVLTVPENLIVEACQRIKEFCEMHFKYD